LSDFSSTFHITGTKYLSKYLECVHALGNEFIFISNSNRTLFSTQLKSINKKNEENSFQLIHFKEKQSQNQNVNQNQRRVQDMFFHPVLSCVLPHGRTGKHLPLRTVLPSTVQFPRIAKPCETLKIISNLRNLWEALGSLGLRGTNADFAHRLLRMQRNPDYNDD
jgi:hypothetical protein